MSAYMTDSVGAAADGGGIEGGDEVRAAILQRLREVTAPDYVDPARKDLTGLDWFALVGFMAACAVIFTVWGY